VCQKAPAVSKGGGGWEFVFIYIGAAVGHQAPSNAL
jgi:hypothetical protein